MRRWLGRRAGLGPRSTASRRRGGTATSPPSGGRPGSPRSGVPEGRDADSMRRPSSFWRGAVGCPGRDRPRVLDVRRVWRRSSAVVALAFGSVDFALDVGADENDDSLTYARQHVSSLAVARAGLTAPIDGVTVDVDDVDLRPAAHGPGPRQLGFSGKLCIHPARSNRSTMDSRPSAEETAWAARVLERRSVPAGTLRAFRVDGRMVDRPVLPCAASRPGRLPHEGGRSWTPLDGITVVALEQAVAAPFATRQLADLGARVIKVERPGAGDFARDYDRSVLGQASYFVWLNRGKESSRARPQDAERPGGAGHDLVDEADVLVQNLAPGAVDRLGLDAATLRARPPELIHCSISGYGAERPLRHEEGLRPAGAVRDRAARARPAPRRSRPRSASPSPTSPPGCTPTPAS